MLQHIKRIFSIPELRTKIVYTLLLLAACRIGVFIPVPGINGEMVMGIFRQQVGGSQNLFQLVDIFSGGAFSQMTVVALGIVPYISASIMLQLITAILPGLQREMRENPELGKRKMNKWTRLLTVALALFQSMLFARYALANNAKTPGIIVGEILNVHFMGIPWLFFLVVMVTMTAGTLVLMWIGEQITEKGIGNGISLIITLGILSSLPSAIGSIVSQLNLDSQQPGQINFATLLVLLSIFVIVTVGTILIIQGQRKIPLQYARRIVGRREVQGSSACIPLKVNYAGVLPVIFGSALLMFPATLSSFMGPNSFIGQIGSWLYPGSTLHTALYVFLIIAFTFFWTATQFNPEQIASDMKKNGAFIPGIRQGKPTKEFLESSMNKITLIGGVLLATIAVFPTLLGKFMGVDPRISYFFGGTSLLIMVGVILDTMKQIESHLIMKRYDGFMTKGKRIRGRG
ncbi:MAG: preprotein translocase subunit SecY [Chlamydiota bacterium]